MHPEGKRGASTRGRGRGRGAGRGKRGKRVCISSDEEPGNDPPPPSQVVEPVQPMEQVAEPAEPLPDLENVPPKIDIEADISQLEAPTFTTITRGPPEPMVRLKWTHKVLLIGEKVLNPMIHCCGTCLLPILHYGRMIPCKHVFCLMCAKREPIKECPRCKDKVCRVEQSGLGTVFMCTHGGSRYNNKGCRRTYLSQRDLQAHINHRHRPVAPVPNRPPGNESTADKAGVDNKGTPMPRKPPQTTMGGGSTTPNAAFRSGGANHPAQSNTPSVRTNLMNMQENISDESMSRHSSSRNWNNSNSYR